jgi:hypothetical protein
MFHDQWIFLLLLTSNNWHLSILELLVKNPFQLWHSPYPYCASPCCWYFVWLFVIILIFHYSHPTSLAILLWTFAPSPYKFWTFFSFFKWFSSAKKLSRMLVIYVLYFITCWNILAALLCSSNFASNPCIDPGVWNLGVYPLELVFEDPKLLCEV